MFAEVQAVGMAYFLVSMIGSLFVMLFCFMVLVAVFVELPQYLSGRQWNYEFKEAVMMACFFVGFCGGMWLSGEIYVALAIELGFRQGDLPGLPKFR